MPWTMKDYPDSMKNLDDITKKKAIDIANSMVDENYDESRAIPIAMEQAKKWRKNASKKELEQYQASGNPTTRSEEGKKYASNPERLEEGEQVLKHEDGWAVKSSHAKKPTAVFEQKEAAVKRAREIAKNKGTKLTVYTTDGSVQEQQTYSS
ncbi:DUF2188 domain-containing protein [Ornithinibacillus gellani]|uniref:DUF2188 domain-containing protein n=1 Tax=Ornithinibacillus gellani TaxID=2293253 RepID=UPI000F4A6BCE|nr:DUF2188 domain-containing protein [Ornithinibacillus gellani]TQS76505.1 DUF2188 domain-containing protein [Ornithinibacillus gellani]